MKIHLPIYQVDAFSDKLFQGNPAAVILCDRLLPDHLMHSIAAENNLAETAFVYGGSGELSIRWFTPTVEVDLCGHATLAAAHILFEIRDAAKGTISLSSRSGPLRVRKSDDLLWLNFPADQFTRVTDLPRQLLEGIGTSVQEVYRGRTDYLAILNNENAVSELKPIMSSISQLECRGVIVSARGHQFDFVSRFFAPQSGIPEDPVTGSAHTTLTPYWSKQLNKQKLKAGQLSQRGGVLFCEDHGDRVEIGGSAVTYMVGEIVI